MSSFGGALRAIGAHGRLPDASAQGWRGDELFGWITVVVAIVFVIVLVHLAWVTLRSRAGLPSASRGDDLRARLIVIGATLLLFLAVDGVALVRGGRDLDEGVLRVPTAAERPVEVEVLAQQWAWSFRLAGNDGKLGTDDDVVSLHALKLPAGRPALLALRSKDVIHSLYVPALRVKRDAQPGVTNTLLLEPVVAGRYEIACAQHCGANHYLMRATLDVLPEAAWASWVSTESERARRMAAARASDGNWSWSFGEGAR